MRETNGHSVFGTHQGGGSYMVQCALCGWNEIVPDFIEACEAADNLTSLPCPASDNQDLQD